jgi:hypothetical protein
MDPQRPDSVDQDGILIPTSEVPADFVPRPAGEPPDTVSLADEYLRESARAEELYAQAMREGEHGGAPHHITHLLRAAKHAEVAHEWHLAALAFHAAADAFAKPGSSHDMARAFRMYHRAIAAYDRCGHFDDSRKLEYRVAILRLRHARELGLSWGERTEMLLYWATAGFGYRPFRVLMTGVVQILLFGLVYWLAGGIITSDEAPVNDFASAAYFSGSTFLTINYGDLLPASHVRWLTVLEGLLGLTTISFFVVMLSNRLRQ